MFARPEHIVGRWLRKMGIVVSPSLLKEQLNTHPDYPSLLSISDCLDNLGIDNAALVIDKERLNEAPLPFLAHETARSRFIIIENIREQISENTEFSKYWNGAALLAEKPECWRNEENEKQLKADKKKIQNIFLAVLSLIWLAGLSLLNAFSWQMAGLLLTAIAGLAVSVLIIQHELGISNEITGQLCGAGKNLDCNAVMNSEGSKIGKWLNWADAGVLFFSSFLIALVAAIYTGSTAVTTILAFLSAAAIPFTVFSLYYQWRVVKKWCPLCLLTIAVLWLQFSLLFPILGSLTININAAAFVSFVFISSAIIWLMLLKPALEKNKELTGNNFRLLRFKYDPSVFEALLSRQRRVDTSPFENEIQLGNPNAPVQIMVACNPYCGPCAKTHEVLHELIEGNDAGLSVRFMVDTQKKNKHLQAVEYILQLLSGKGTAYKRQVLDDWYLQMDLKEFSEKYMLISKKNADWQLEKHEKWVKETGISFTPTIFINGNQLPRQYVASDVKLLLRGFQRKKAETKKTMF